MKLFATLALLLALLFANADAQNLSTRGTDFWLTFMENSDDPYRLDDPTRILFVSAQEACQVTVSIGNRVVNRVSVPAMGSVRIDVTDPKSIQTTSDLLCRDCAVHVESTQPVSLYAFNSVNQSTDATIVLPVPALGETSVLASYPHYFQTVVGGVLDWSGLFAVVGVEDNTVVEITPSTIVASNTMGQRQARVPFRVDLDKGDVIQFKTRNGYDSREDLTGTTVRVVASNGECGKVAVFSGHQRTAIPSDESSRDHLFEHMPPVATLGTEHVIPPLERAIVYDLRVITTEPNTNVTIDGIARNVVTAHSFTTETNLNARRHHTVDANKPVLVVMYAQSQPYAWVNDGPGDPLMVVVPPISQRIDNATIYAFVPNDQEGWEDHTYITLLTPSTNMSTVTCDGYPLTSMPYTVGELISSTPAAKGLSTVILRVQPGVHTVDASQNGGLLALVHGLANVDSYGFVAGASYSNLRTSILLSSSPYCPGRPISFRGYNSDSLNVVSWQWLFHDGKTASGKETARAFADTGTYLVKLIMQRTDCGADTAYATVRVTNPLRVTLTGPDVVCVDSTATLRATVVPAGRYTYRWSPLGDDGIVSSNIQSTVDVLHRRPGKYRYEVTATDNSGCSIKDTLDVNFTSPPTIDVVERFVVCEGEELTINATVRDTSQVQIKWMAEDSLDISSLVGDPSKPGITLRPKRTGQLAFIIRAQNSYGCTESKRVVVVVVARPLVAGIGANKVFSCLDDSLPPMELGTGFTITGGVPPFRYEWREQGGGTSSFRGPTNTLTTLVKPKQTTTYVLTVHDSNPLKDCPTTVTITVDLRPVPDAKAGEDAILCACDADTAAVLGIDARCGRPPYQYKWTPNVGLTNAQSTTTAVTKARPTQTTTYVLAVSDASGTTNYDTVTVRIEPCPDVAIRPVASQCGADTAYRLSSFIRNGVNGLTYAWEPATYLDDPTSPNPTARIPSTNSSVTYKVTARSQYGCEGSAEVSFQHSTGPRVSLQSDYECSQDTLCRGDEVQIDATVIGGVPSYKYTWTSNPAVLPGWTSNQRSIRLPLLRTTVFYVTAVDSLGCSSRDSIRICVDPVPNVKPGIDTTICASDIANVIIDRGQLSTCGKPPFVYDWSPKSDLTIPNPSEPWRVRLTPTKTTTYTLRVTDDGGAGLSTQDSVRVTVRDAISMALSADSLSYCPDQYPDTLSVFPDRGLAPYTMRFAVRDSLISEVVGATRGALLPNQMPKSPGDYIIGINVIDANGCVVRDTVHLRVYEPPTVTVRGNASICLCDSVTIEALGVAGRFSSNGNLRYSWKEQSEDAPAGTVTLQSSTARVQVVKPQFNTVYVVTATDEHGCSSQAAYSVKVNSSASSVTLRADTILADPKKQDVAIPIKAVFASDSIQCPPEGLSFSLRYREDLYDPFPRVDPGVITSNAVTVIDDVKWRTISVSVQPFKAIYNNDIVCTLRGKALIGAPGYTPLEMTKAQVIYRCDTSDVPTRNGLLKLDSLCIAQDSIARLLNFNADGIVSIFPNPATGGEVDVRVRKVIPGSATLSIVDVSGRVLEEKTVTIATRDLVTLRMKTPSLVGMYRIVLRTSTGQSQMPIVVTSGQ
jgi:hypothetical protein